MEALNENIAEIFYGSQQGILVWLLFWFYNSWGQINHLMMQHTSPIDHSEVIKWCDLLYILCHVVMPILNILKDINEEETACLLFTSIQLPIAS